MRTRQERARAAAGRAGLAALLVVGRSFYDRTGDLAYLSSHFPPFPSTVFSEANRGMGHAFLLLPTVGEPVLLTDPRRHRADLVAVEDVRAHADLGGAVVALLREKDLSRRPIGLVSDDILPAAFDRQFSRELPRLRLEATPDIVSRLRRIKSPAEQSLLRYAARCADAGLTSAMALIDGDPVTERDVCAAGTAAALRAGADFVRYFRVHSGPWSAAGSRWPPAMDRTIEDGEIVAMDIIGAYQGYQFDVNRTAVRGQPDDRQRALLETVNEAVAEAVAACVAGATVGEVIARATRVIERQGFGEHAGPMMGHGIGLETVEEPYLQRDGTTVLEPGMVLCVEPGIFVHGWAGAAIEQEVIVSASGPPEIITPTATGLWPAAE